MVIDKDSDLCKKKLEKVTPVVLCGKDCNGLNILHKVSTRRLSDLLLLDGNGTEQITLIFPSFQKAAGLGCTDIAREIVEKCPATVLAQDNDGKTPLHYAAAVKDDGAMYNLLVEYGADESKLDNVSGLSERV